MKFDYKELEEVKQHYTDSWTIKILLKEYMYNKESYQKVAVLAMKQIIHENDLYKFLNSLKQFWCKVFSD